MAFFFLTPLIIMTLIVFSTSQETCEKKDVCSCQFKNGSTVSLRHVDGSQKDPSFQNIKDTKSGERKFAWNPCTPFNTDNGCKDILVCQEASGGDINAGTQDTKFTVDTEGNVVISYGGIKGSDDYTRESQITLKCSPSQPGDGTIPQFTGTLNLPKETISYKANFTSKFACAELHKGKGGGGLSVGSILLIIFFPLVLMYVVIGILINFYGRGIESMPELLPNHSFWADFPFLVKDGVVFTFGCIKSGCSSLSRKCGKDGYAEI